MQQKLSLSLKLFALYFWAYIPTFIISLLPQKNTFVGEIFIREAQVVNWEFELLFVLIFFVWGIYLWKASKTPKDHTFFINFTIWASVVHILWMLIIAFIQPADMAHMIRDAVVLAIPLGLVVYFRRERGGF